MNSKSCNGVLHNGAMIPHSEFWIIKKGRKAGRLHSRCIACERARMDRVDSGWIAIDRVQFIFTELENRLGRAEAQRRLEVCDRFYAYIPKQKYFQLRTVKRAMLVLREVRSTNEVRHRLSIKHGSSQRGYPEREIKGFRDYYKSHGDREGEQKVALGRKAR